ncbi:outer membrane protein OmpA-like peptidoglycan-associated protein [Algoriphagus iocasae]|uniref:Outer membrane protein OmpA-like peptidoglycan-associated protein n=1 Tax=Algoriphagus iocasae TaxID=1836499 RepID=A0A841N0G1_9BACT|nr:OmpA family protein [Algoriphagus iocasae]MBB6327701.1 outer membrane protein OmpA-like peptidoglycan-associated protein [Algoriphagus iocasae]
MKKLLTILFLISLVSTAQAQLHGNKWRVGFSAGTTNYLGDIKPLNVNNFQNFTKLYKRYENYSEQLSFQFSLEYALGNSVGLMLSAGSYQFGAGDRFVKNDGSLYTESPTFDRALNFQTDLYDAGFSFVFKPDNNWLLSGKSFFAPYLTLGLGVQTFNVYGDLLDANGNRYDYTNVNTIPDGTFETKLSDLNTENPNGYKSATLYANVGLGFRFRITKSLEIFAQSDFKRAATDYLDDVSGVYRTSYENYFQAYAAKPGTNTVTVDNPYRGFENGRKDWYIYHGIGIKFSFGANKEAFRPPVITQRYTYVPTELSQKQLTEKEQEMNLKAAGTTNNYFTVIQLPSNGSDQKSGFVADSVQLMEIQNEIDSLQSIQEQLNFELDSAQNEISGFDQAIALAERDSTVSANIREIRVTNFENEKSVAVGKLTSLNSVANQNQFKLDSLKAIQSSSSPEQIALDSAAMMRELIIYPGQVSRILYSAGNPTVLQLDSAQQSAAMKSASQNGMMTREQFDEEMENFRSEMLQSQATRDSAMMMAFASKIPEVDDTRVAEAEPQELTVNTEAMDDKTAKKIEKNRKKQEKLEKKNNELLKDALLVGGTAATTAAIANSGDKKAAAEQAAYDSTLLARIALDSVLIDSLSNIPRIVDTVEVEKTIPSFFNESKIEVYFEINKTTLTDQEIQKLMPVVEHLRNNPSSKVELIGFADNTGSVSYNLAISEKRVDEVARILVEDYQISSDRIDKNNGGLIIRGSEKGSEDKDRKVEIRIMN